MKSATPTLRLQPRSNPTVHVVGLAVLMLAPGLLFSAAIEWASTTSHDEIPLLVSAALCAVVGAALRSSTSAVGDVRPVTVFSIVAWSWIASSVFGSLPYLLGDMFTWSEWDSALFEAASGFSCTGSTVLSDIEANGRGVLMWRQLTQWYGGMGMVVLAVSVLPYLGVGGLALMTAEAPGHSSDRLAPRVSETARRLWILYAGVTVALATLLWITPGMNLYDSVAHAFTTAATGGFSPYNASVGHFDSVAVELILVGFMIFCGISFALHYRAITGDPSAYRRSGDTMLFLGYIAAVFVLVLVINIDKTEVAIGTVVRDAVFNVVTLSSSTGFSNARPGGFGDFVLWPAAAQILLLGVMVVGGCVGSTAGGVKTYRLYIAFKHTMRELRQLQHPRGVFAVKMGDTVVAEDIVASALAFVGMFFLLAATGTVVIAALGVDLVTAASGTVSAMSNMGPALGEAGPTSNFLVFPRPARGLLAALMIIGRLEISAVLLMFGAVTRARRLNRANEHVQSRRKRVSAAAK